jgi:hypothetical protein
MSRKSGLMSGMWKRSMAKLVRHRQPKGPVTDRPSLKPPRHISTPQLSTIIMYGVPGTPEPRIQKVRTNLRRHAQGKPDDYQPDPHRRIHVLPPQTFGRSP